MKNSNENSTVESPVVEKSKRGRKPKAIASPEAKGQVATSNQDLGSNDLVKKAGKTQIDPRKIEVKFDDVSLGRNPRRNYGNDSEWKQFKEIIKRDNVQQALKIFLGKDNKYQLRHGFRRLKAVLELISEGVDIKLVPVDIVSNNEEEGLIEHFTLNTGKLLTDIEQAEGLRTFKKLTGNSNIKQLSEQLGIDYVKASTLDTFMNNSTSAIRNAVHNGTITFSMAKAIVKNAPSQADQAVLLKEGIKKAKDSGKNKVRGHHISSIKNANRPLDKKLIDILEDGQKDDNLDHDFINRTLNLINMLKENIDVEAINKVLAIDYSTEEAESAIPA